MDRWLLQEETPFEQSLLIGSASRAARAKETYSILLRAVKVLDNRRLFGSADVVVYCVAVDGYPDMKSGTPFWAQQFQFFKVKDGAMLPIDAEAAPLIYLGRPRDFLNLYMLVIRDTQSTRDFAQLLKDNFIAQGIGTVAGAAISIYTGLPPGITAPVARDLTVKAVETTLDYFTKQKNVVIGTYYGSLTRGDGYGIGPHPSDYPASLKNCGDALAIAYEVRKDAK